MKKVEKKKYKQRCRQFLLFFFTLPSTHHNICIKKFATMTKSRTKNIYNIARKSSLKTFSMRRWKGFTGFPNFLKSLGNSSYALKDYYPVIFFFNRTGNSSRIGTISHHDLSQSSSQNLHIATGTIHWLVDFLLICSLRIVEYKGVFSFKNLTSRKILCN